MKLHNPFEGDRDIRDTATIAIATIAFFAVVFLVYTFGGKGLAFFVLGCLFLSMIWAIIRTIFYMFTGK